MNELTTFVEKLSTKHKFQIAYKNQSNLMKLIGFLLFFNKGFMSNYITTIGNKVYFPSSEFLLRHSTAMKGVTAHEFTHIWDAQRTGSLKWHLLYLFPQLLAVLALLAFFAFLWTPALWALVALVFAIPWPAYWRKKYELLGYTMSLFVLNESMKRIGYDEQKRRVELLESAKVMDKNQFRGPYYWYMWPFGVKKELNQAIESILSGDILNTEEVFPFVLECLKESVS